MKSSVLTINPWIYDYAAYDYWMKPLGLLYLAACLRENGLDVRLIDCLDPDYRRGASRLRRPPPRKPGGHGKLLRERIAAPSPLAATGKPYHRYGIDPDSLIAILTSLPRPRAVFVTSLMTYWYPGVDALIGIIKNIFPGVPVILGGVYATLCPDHAAANSGADLILPGRGETQLEFIVRDIIGASLSYLPQDGDLDSLPYPAFDLLPRPDQLPVLTSRGCPYRCPYCASGLLYRGFTRRKPDLVAAEIRHWKHALGVDNFSIYDDAFLIRPEELAVPLLREIITRNMDVSFHCPNGLHLREITPEIAVLLRRAGFRTLRFGLETTHGERQLQWGGKVENLHFEQAVAYLQEAGYTAGEIAVYLLCGLPGQTAAEIESSIRYVQSRGARPILAEYSPIPGTPLWKDACASSPYPLAEEPLFHNNSLLPCAHPSLTTSVYHELRRLCRSS